MTTPTNFLVYTEIVRFLDITFPEWKTHEGLGSSGEEFVSNCIENNLYLFNDKVLTNKQRYKTLFSDISRMYVRYKTNYVFIFNDYCRDTFFKNDELFFETDSKNKVDEKYKKHVLSLKYKTVFFPNYYPL